MYSAAQSTWSKQPAPRQATSLQYPQQLQVQPRQLLRLIPQMDQRQRVCSPAPSLAKSKAVRSLTFNLVDDSSKDRKPRTHRIITSDDSKSESFLKLFFRSFLADKVLYVAQILNIKLEHRYLHVQAKLQLK